MSTKKLTTDEVIRRLKKVHGDRYDYSKLVFVNSNTKIKVICSEHGEFETTYHTHLKSNCGKCVGISKLTNEDFTVRGNKIHKGKYDYSLVEYKTNKDKVIIICPVHGIFEQSPGEHITKKRGCIKCSEDKIKVNLLKVTNKIHKGKYDYSLVEYKGVKYKIKIICPVHGVFEQLPSNHRKSGCPKCGDISTGNKQNLTTEEFINRSIKIHGNTLNYSKVKYVNYKTKVTIICPVHGEFEQIPSNHLDGIVSCEECIAIKRIKDGIKLSKKLGMSTDRFTTKAKAIHGDKYDYSKTEYITSKVKLTITCPKHGEFKQRPLSHLDGNGCSSCSGTATHTTITFIDFSKNVHGDKYDYSLVNYKTNKDKVIIICSEHGEFEQQCSSHLRGSGCPRCAGQGRTTKEFIIGANLAHNNKYDYTLSEYKGSGCKVKILCPKHGVFEQLPWPHIHLEQGCPTCRESKGEKKVKRIIEDYKLNYNQQKRFDDCRYKYPLPFDFYLPEYNTCIEYDGILHFEVSRRWGNKQKLADAKRNDAIKTKYCKENNIPLIRIRYDEDVEEKLNEGLIKYGIIKV